MQSVKEFLIVAGGVYVGLVLASITLTWIDTILWGVQP